MLRAIPKTDYLAALRARVEQNRATVHTVFVPLSLAERSWQPAPDEWGVDQCFWHLVMAFRHFVRFTEGALEKPQPAGFDGIFRPSFWARRFLEWQFDPKNNLRSMRKVTPTTTSHPAILDEWLDQQATLLDMIEHGAGADLQTMCWLITGLPIRYNLGDYLNYFISHDDLHLGQAQWVLDRIPAHVALAAD